MINHICDSAIREKPHCCSGIYNTGAWNKQMHWNKFIRDSDLFGLWALANRNQRWRIFFSLFFFPLVLHFVFLPPCFSGRLTGNVGLPRTGVSQLCCGTRVEMAAARKDKGYLSYLTANHTEYIGKRSYLVNSNKQETQREGGSLLATLVWATPYKKWNPLGSL